MVVLSFAVNGTDCTPIPDDGCDCAATAPTYPVFRETVHVDGCRFSESMPLFRRPPAKGDLLRRLTECAANADTEVAHSDADAALIAYIDDPDVTAAWERLEKWYA